MIKKMLLLEVVCNECSEPFYLPDTPELTDEKIEELTCPQCGNEGDFSTAHTLIAKTWRGEDLEGF